jgi:large subunit ribosomal protein L7/L12
VLIAILTKNEHLPLNFGEYPMSAIVEELVEKIGNLTLVEAADLKKALEEKFGVSAAAPVMVAGAAAGAAPAAAAEEKTEFDVELTDGGAQIVKEAVSKADADALKKKLEEAGAKVTLK